MGRPVGKRTSKDIYTVKFLTTNDENPEWHTYNCSSYEHICQVLEEKHNVKYTRNVVCNICLQRRDKKNHYPNIKVSRI